MTIQFDSRNADSKAPFGAVKTGQPIHFCVRCGHNDADVRIIVRNDADTFEQRVALLPAETDADGLTAYRGTITLYSADLYFYRFEIRTQETLLFCGKSDSQLQTGDWLPEWQLTVYEADFTTPDWIKGGVMYQIFPDRFAQSNTFTPLPISGERIRREDWGGVPQSALDTPNYAAKDFFGGSLKGITEHLDHLEALGVTLLYLNPIFEGPENHRYGTGDYFNIDPWLGQEADFTALCKACECRDIRVILDGVFSHTGADSRYFNRFGHYPETGAFQSKDSPYYSWYQFAEWPNDYACWWNFPNLPEVAEENADYVRFITGKKGVLAHWQTRGCKGWRLDVADELPEGFLDRIRAAVKAADPDAFILGEVWEDASNKISQGHRRHYLLGQQLDSVMNYPFRTAIIDFALSGNSAKFQDEILTILENYPQPAIDAAMNMLSTHDTVRILNELGVVQPVERTQKAGHMLSKEEYETGKNRLKIAAFLQFTLPGIPSIYYGDEVGLTGFEDPFNRNCYPWGQEDYDLLSFFKTLSAFRKSHRDDFSAGFSPVLENSGLFAFRRGKILCITHFGEEPQPMTLAKAPIILFSGGGVDLEGTTLLLKAQSFVALKITD
ncbi:glycoside hydrolase family 13 protein [Oscillospiraceae bacterium LTW-04]|nr:glycoside hydrolase family 13 protein [Oscillospiraceae bacterium MB24-C1]